MAAWEMTSSSSSGTPDSQVRLPSAGGPARTFMLTIEVLDERPCACWHGHVLVEELMCLLRQQCAFWDGPVVVGIAMARWNGDVLVGMTAFYNCAVL